METAGNHVHTVWLCMVAWCSVNVRQHLQAAQEWAPENSAPSTSTLPDDKRCGSANSPETQCFQISQICAQHCCWPSGMRVARILATRHTSSIVSCIRKKRPFPVNFACAGILEPSWFSSLVTKSLHSEFPEIPSKTYSFLSNIIVTRVTSEKSTHIQISCERQSWWWQSCQENLLSLEFSTWVCRDV